MRRDVFLLVSCNAQCPKVNRRGRDIQTCMADKEGFAGPCIISAQQSKNRQSALYWILRDAFLDI